MIAPSWLGIATKALVLAALISFAGSTPARAAAKATKNSDEPVLVELNEGRLIRLSRAANSVFIANPEIADVAVKSPRLVYVFGNKPGETTLYAVDRNDRMIANVKIQVEHNMSRLNSSLAKLVASGEITAKSLDGTIVLTGKVADSVDAENARRLSERFLGEGEEVINQIQVIAPNQVNLRVRIAEVQRTVIKQFGFNWETAFANSDFTLGLATGNPFLLGNIGDLASLSPPLSLFGDPQLDRTFITRQGETNSIFGATNFGNYDLNGLIDILASDNLVTILAEPNLTALSGETASFLAGGEFPIPIVEDDTVVILFKEFGISLSFTPTTLTGRRISLRVRPEVSQLSNQGSITLANFVIPGITTRRAETTVEVGSGQTFAIAGLFSDNSLEELDQIPGISEIPILGEFFDNDRFERRETELMIVVTPYLVQPSNLPIPVPTDAYVERSPGTPGRRNLALRPFEPETIRLNNGSPLAQVPAGQAGFIVE